MATNTRVRIDSDIEAYIKSQSERVMGIEPDKLSASDLTTLTNRILYEHKLAPNDDEARIHPASTWLA
jgi:hypothetical protein